MPVFTNPFNRLGGRRTRGSTGQQWPRQRRTTRIVSAGSGVVTPGRVVTKEERSNRKPSTRADSTVSNCDGQPDDKRAAEDGQYEYSFSALKDKLVEAPRTWSWPSRLGRDIDEHFAPGACAATSEQIRSETRPQTFRSLIVLIILLLIVFGVLYTLVEYLLFATRASACSVSTVFIPVTYTVTAGANSISTSDPTHSMNETSTETITSYVTVPPPPPSSSSKLPYIYTTNSAGSTEWVNGNSPSPGVSLVTATTSVFVAPIASTEGGPQLSTTTEITYLTVPTYTSTAYSYVSPDVTLTSTRTSTHYVTSTLERVNNPVSSSRSSFSGIASAGWNHTSSTSTEEPAAPSSLEPESTTYTSVYYLPASSSDPTTSTTTTFVTTTVALLYTTTVLPNASADDDDGYVTTITALPVTISPNTGSEPKTATANAVSQSFQASILEPTIGSSAALDTITATHSSPVDAASGGSPASVLEPTIGSSAASGIITATHSSPAKGSASPTMPQISTLGFTPAANQSSNSPSTLSPEPVTNTQMPYGHWTPIETSSTAPSVSITTSHSSPSQSWSSAPSNGSSSMHSPETSLSVSFVPFITSTVSAEAASSGTPSTLSAGSQTAGSTSQNGSSPSSYGSATASSQSGSSQSITTTSASQRSAMSTVSGNATSSNQHSGTLTKSTTRTTRKSSIPHSGHSSSSSSSTASSSKVSSTLASTANSVTGHTLTSKTTTTVRPATSPTSKASSSSLPPYVPLGSSTQSQRSLTSSSSSSSKTISHFHNPFPATSATATPSAGCGEHGRFMINFDDLPNFMPTENDTAITQAPPIQNPYHHLTFSDGYVYAPAPSEPYAPVSSPHLAVFLSNATGMTARGPTAHYSKPGEIGDGPRESESAFWFDADSAWFGCDNPGPKVCTLVFSAYTWSAVAKDEVLTFQQNATVSACKDFKDCHLQLIDFPTSFRGLTGVQIQAFVDNQPKMFFMDNLAMRWSNNSCAAGMLRQSSS